MSLLSFIPSSCIVAPNREIMNTNIISSISAMSNSLESKAISENIQISASRGKTTVLSTNSSRESSVISKASSVKYATCMEAQSIDLNWTNQTKDKFFRLSYATLLGGDSNIHGQTIHSDNMPTPHLSQCLLLIVAFCLFLINHVNQAILILGMAVLTLFLCLDKLLSRKLMSITSNLHLLAFPISSATES